MKVCQHPPRARVDSLGVSRPRLSSSFVAIYRVRVGHQPGGTWGRARRLTAVTGGPGAAVAAVVAVSGLGSAGGVGYCGRLGTLRNGSRPRGTAGAAAGGVANRSIRAWSGSGPGSGSGPDYGPDYGPD